MRGTIGAKLRKQRGELTLAQVDAGTGIDKAILSRVERNESAPSVRTLKVLANFYQVGDDVLLDWIDTAAAGHKRKSAA